VDPKTSTSNNKPEATKSRNEPKPARDRIPYKKIDKETPFLKEGSLGVRSICVSSPFK